MRLSDDLQAQLWPHERLQPPVSREVHEHFPETSSAGPVTRSWRPALLSQSSDNDNPRLHPRRSYPSCGLQRHHSSLTAAPAPPLPPRQRPNSALEAPSASLQRLRSTFEAADRKARAGAEAPDEEAHREDFWRELDTLERQERAGFAWDDDEDAWVTNAAKEEKWKILKDPGDRQDMVADLERMFLDLDLDRDDLMEKAERRMVPDQVMQRLKCLKEEEEDSDHIGPLSPSNLPSASPLASRTSTLQSHASTNLSYNHIPQRAPFPHRLRDDKAYRRLHPNVQAPTISRKPSSLSSGANSASRSGMATPSEATEEKSDGKLRAASAVQARSKPSPTSADYLLPRETGTLERRKQWPPPYGEDPDLKIDDMAYRRLVKPVEAAKPQKNLIGKPRPTPFSEEEMINSNGKSGGKQTWWPYARVHEMKRQGLLQDVDDEII